jgi:hypothetical protein
MKKISDLREGDLITVEAAAKLIGCPKKYLYESHAKSKLHPDKYIRGAKIGGKLFFLKSTIIDHLNREFSKAS